MSSNPRINDQSQWTEYKNAVNWAATTGILVFFGVYFSMMLSLALCSLVAKGFSRDSLGEAVDFFMICFRKPWHVFVAYWWWLVLFLEKFRDFIWYLYIPLIPLYVLFKGVKYTMKKNPYRFINTFFGGAKEGNYGDAVKMGLDGKYILIGKMKGNGKYLKTNDMRSVLCTGTTGMGKTEGVVVPAILEAEDVCMIIHESGKLFDLTSGYRATKGHVFMLDFSTIDNYVKNEIYPAWNPLSPGNLPSGGPGRYNYIGGLCYMLIKDGPTGADPYWAKAGRSALEGFTNYICDKCDHAKANDYFIHRLLEGGFDKEDHKVLMSYYQALPQKERVLRAMADLEAGRMDRDNYLPIGKWDPIPVEWHGRQASFPMLIDMVTLIQMEINEDLKEKRDKGDPSYYTANPWGIIIENMLKESVEYSYSRRAILELNQILNLPPVQRSSVLSTAFAGIGAFKNSAVRQRTSLSDIYYKDLRGIRDPETGEFKPISLYVAANDSYDMAGVFFNITTGYVLSFPPGTGEMGPYPLLYVLDNFHRMGNMPKFINNVGMGRSQKVAFLIVVQDLAQVAKEYSEGEVDVLMTNCSIKVIKNSNNNESAQRFGKLIPGRTRLVATGYSYSENFFGRVKNWQKNVSYKWAGAGIPGITGSAIYMVMNNKDQIVLVQGNLQRPFKLQTPHYKKEPDMLVKTEIPKAGFVDQELLDERMEEDKNPPLYVNFETVFERRQKVDILKKL